MQFIYDSDVTGAELRLSDLYVLAASDVLSIGDVNCDGAIDLLDVAPFVESLLSGKYNAKADINTDGVVNLLDVAPFVDLLTGG